MKSRPNNESDACLCALDDSRGGGTRGEAPALGTEHSDNYSEGDISAVSHNRQTSSMMVGLRQADSQPDARSDTLGPSAEARTHTHMATPCLGLIAMFQLAAEGRRAARLPSG